MEMLADLWMGMLEDVVVVLVELEALNLQVVPVF